MSTLRMDYLVYAAALSEYAAALSEYADVLAQGAESRAAYDAWLANHDAAEALVLLSAPPCPPALVRSCHGFEGYRRCDGCTRGDCCRPTRAVLGPDGLPISSPVLVRQ